MKRGEIWWAELDPPRQSGPGYRRPVLIIQSDKFNESKINTIICIVISSNLNLKSAPGNLLITSGESGLAKDSIINVSQVLTIDRIFLTEYAGAARNSTMAKIKHSLHLVLEI